MIVEIETPRTYRESVDLFRIGKTEVEANPDGIDFSGPMFELLNATGQFTREAALDFESAAFSLLVDLAPNEQDRKVLELVSGNAMLGRCWLAPPDVPADRLAALRESFWKAVNDPEMQAQAKKRKMPITPIPWEELQARAAQIADTDADVLVNGETGTGKELVARALHETSRRSERNFVAVNCGAVPDNLIVASQGLLVTDENGRLVGALNFQDLLKAGVV